jgi:hypothetical protein
VDTSDDQQHPQLYSGGEQHPIVSRSVVVLSLRQEKRRRRGDDSQALANLASLGPAVRVRVTAPEPSTHDEAPEPAAAD